MSRLKKWLLVFLGSVALVVLGFLAFSIFAPKYTVVLVGSEIITTSDISKQTKLQQSFEEYSKSGKDKQTIFAEAKQTLIKRKLISAEAKRRDVTVSDLEITNYISSTSQKILSAYKWQETDLRNQIYYQLLEQKLRENMEGRTKIQAVFLVNSPTAQKDIEAISLATKRSFQNDTDFNVIEKEASQSAAKANVTVQFLDQQYKDVDFVKLFRDPGTKSLFQSLKDKEVKIAPAQNYTVIAYAKEKKYGVDFDEWLNKAKASQVKEWSIGAKETYATTSAYYTCGAGSFCASDQNDCAANNAMVCSFDTAPGCRASNGAFPVCCISYTWIYGNVTDGASNPLSGVNVSAATTSQTCPQPYYSSITNYLTATTDGSGYYFVGYFNCNDAPIALSFTKSGYNNNNTSVSLVNGIGNTVNAVMTPTGGPTPKYRCSGSSCIRDDNSGVYTTSNCNGACASSCASINTYVNPNPVAPNTSFNIDFTSATGYTNIGFDAGGGASCSGPSPACCNCGNPHGDNPCWWRFTCTSGGSSGGYTATFTNAQSCTGNVNYTVACDAGSCGSNPCTGACGQQTCLNSCGSGQIVDGCSCSPCPPNKVNLTSPTSGAINQPLTVSLQWLPVGWGYACNGSNTHTYDVYWRRQGGAWTGPITVSVPTYLLSGLTYDTIYEWYVVAYNGQQYGTTSDTWNFRTRPQGWWQSVGGDAYGSSIASIIPSGVVATCRHYIGLSN